MKWGIQMIRNPDYAAMAEDKLGGICWMKQDDVNVAEMEILANAGRYRRTRRSEVSAEAIGRGCVRMAKRIESLEDEPGLGAMLMKPLRQDSNSIATLKLTVKTHKEQGKVGFRAIHALTSWRLEGIARWVARQLRTQLMGSKDFLEVSEDLVDRMKSVRVAMDGKAHFVKADVKDFYYSGSHEMLVHAVTSVFPTGVRKDVVREALELLLVQQWIRRPRRNYTDHDDNEVWQIIEGTGMGLPHSGEVADTSLWALTEKDWIEHDYVLEAYGIAAFTRFRDDVLIVGTDAKRTREFLRVYKGKAKYFKIEIEEVSTVSVRYLQTLLEFADNGRITVSPAFKAEKLRTQPIDTTSAHPWSILSSWPRQMIIQSSSLGTFRADANMAKAILVERFKWFGFPASLVNDLEGIDPWTKKGQANAC